MENIDPSLILKLTVTKKWFNMILSGEKREEYRLIKPHWISRFLEKKTQGFRNYQYIQFTNGYGDHRPHFICKCEGISKGLGRIEWGAPFKKRVFILNLGEIVSQKNIELS